MTRRATAGASNGDLGSLDLPPEGWRYIVQLQAEAATRERELAAQFSTRERELAAQLNTRERELSAQLSTRERELSAQLSAREREFGETRADLERSLGKANLLLEKSSHISQDRATQILRMQGRLNMRGMLELIEREEGQRQAYPFKATRQVKWQQILSRKENASLQACLSSTLGWNTVYFSAHNIVKLYDSLSLNQHPIISAQESQRIGGYVLSDDLRDKERSALKCISEAFGIDYRVVTQGETVENWTSAPLKNKPEENTVAEQEEEHHSGSTD